MNLIKRQLFTGIYNRCLDNVEALMRIDAGDAAEFVQRCESHAATAGTDGEKIAARMMLEGVQAMVRARMGTKI